MELNRSGNHFRIKPARRESGQSTVEFGLTLGFVLLFLMAFVDFGRGIYAYSVIAEAAQEGARYAIINPTDTNGIDSAARERVVGLEQAQLSITPTSIGSSAMEVQVNYLFQPITPLLENAIGDDDGILLTTRARMCRGACTTGN